jgi:ABC-type transport system involved in multi-copper enzyme maturation permease subunit
MLFGPIIHAELIRTARQKRWYLLRGLLGLGLLLVLYQNFGSPFRYRPNGNPNEYSHEELQFIAMRVFMSLLIAQAVAIVVLAPSLTAGAIAEEKQRKTLHYLLASRLTSLEIVVGKLASRLLLIAMPVAIGLPVMVMLGLFGGLDLELMLAGYGAIASTALFEGSLAILVSTLVRRGREALLLSLLVVAAWLIAPIILESLMLGQEPPWPDLYHQWIEPVNRHLTDLSPLCLTRQQNRFVGPNGINLAILWMVVHQVVASILLIGLAASQLRPAFRRQDGAPVFGRGIGAALRRKARRWRPRPICGDDPMLWKETHGTPGSMLVNLVSYLAVIAVGLCAFEALKETVPRAWYSLLSHGYRVGNDSTRHDLNIILRSMNTGLYCVLTLVLAALASTSISREREDDTWISLISTPLDGASILWAKLLGCIWAIRAMIVMIALIWTFGLIMGAIHPLGVLISAVQLAVFVLFTLALGTLISLQSKTTMRAIALTFGVILGLSLGVPILWSIVGRPPFVLGGTPSSPFLFAIGMLSYRDVGVAITKTIPLEINNQSMFLDEIRWMMMAGLLGYLAAGSGLLWAAYRGFERALDRPRRSSKITDRPPELEALAGTGRAAIPAGRA